MLVLNICFLNLNIDLLLKFFFDKFYNKIALIYKLYK